MITVIATGFDGKPRRESARHTQASQPAVEQAPVRVPRERDFLGELERQRSEAGNGTANGHDERQAAAVMAPRFERSVGEPVPVKRPAAYDADDLEIPSFLRRK
jgi:hypothetical protein